MSRLLRDFRLLPLVLLAIGCLFALKTFGLFSEGGYTLGQRLGSGNTLVVTTVPTEPVAELRWAAGSLEVGGGWALRGGVLVGGDYTYGDVYGAGLRPN